jgi:hypothetical protein
MDMLHDVLGSATVALAMGEPIEDCGKDSAGSGAWPTVIRFYPGLLLAFAFGSRLCERSSLLPDRFKRSGIPVIRP